MVLEENSGGNWLSEEISNLSGEMFSLKTVSAHDVSIRKGVFSYMTKKPASKMMIEAIRALSDDTRGASIPAIIKWITGNYAVSDLERLKLNVKKAVKKALQRGTIIRSKTSKGCLGINGSFILGNESDRKLKKRKNWTKDSSLKMSNLNSNIHQTEIREL